MKGLRAAVLAAAVVLVLSAGCMHLLPGFTGATYPKIVPDPAGTMPDPEPYHFSFQDYTVTIDPVPVESAVYAGAKNTEKSARIFDDRIDEDEWLSGIYTSMIGDPAQDRFYEGILSVFRGIRDERMLDDDEYVELISVFVQSIEYENLGLTDPKYPVETYVEGRGDCDDKSMLLAGLLSREGYGVSLFYFDSALHMGVGIECGDTGYNNTGYGYIETTNITLVGIPPSALSGNTGFTADPLVIPVGNGTRTYMRCDETTAIWEKYKETERLLTELEPEIRTLESRIREESDELELQKSNLDAFLARGDLKTYNRLVPAYNTAVVSYNTLLGDYRTKSDEYNALAEIHNYILVHQYDRKGTYEKIFG